MPFRVGFYVRQQGEDSVDGDLFELLLCATSAFSVPLWLCPPESPQRHREHRGCTEKSLKIRLAADSRGF